MKKRYLRRFLNSDDSFTGDYFNGKSIGLPFRIVTSLKQYKNDNTPRIYLVYGKLDNLAKNKNTRAYHVLGPGKIKRITLYHKNGFNEQDEKVLQLFTKIFYKQILDYFYCKDTDTLLSEKVFKQYLI